MSEYKAVPSGLEISQRAADCLEAAAPRGYQYNERARAIRAINDILQGRSARSADELLAELKKCGEEQTAPVRRDIQDFLRQKELLTKPYGKRASRRKFSFGRLPSTEGRTLKVIDQELYDRAARNGFPPDFFRESCFDQVTFYCLPDTVDFYGSELHNCKFAVCRVKGISLSYTHIFDTEFYSSILSHVDFYEAMLAHTHFRDCELSNVMAQKVRMKHCNTIDCTMDGVDYAGATLDGCTFSRIAAGTIRLDYATITQGGATEEECHQNREAVYRALGVKEEAA